MVRSGEAFADSVEDGLEASSDVELPENAVQMNFDRLLADEEGLGDFFVCEARSKVLKDLLLPRRQPFFVRLMWTVSCGNGDKVFIKESGDQFSFHP